MKLTYKGFSTEIHYCAKTDTFYGELIDVIPLTTFQATELADLKQAFYDIISERLEKIETLSSS